MMSNALFRLLPKIDVLVADPRLADLPPAPTLRAARAVVGRARAEIARGERDAVGDLIDAVRAEVEAALGPRLRRVINATGIVLHTNLGRAPMHPSAARAVAEVARGYANVQLRLDTGKRGGRLDGIRAPLQALIGCEDAIAVNNNAAAVLLILAALAKGREVIVSRGELVEIGGSFRVPDVMSASGTILREVGTTNRTRAADYAAAIHEQTALLMRIHPSNFRIVGFTERPSTEALAALPVPLVEDLGSGALVPGLEGEPPAGQVLSEGAALVCFSGDKLLGGPQAGIIAGRADLVEACRRHPLYRALRLDKMVLAALEATLKVYLAGQSETIPALAMLRSVPEEAAEALAARLQRAGLEARVEDDVGYSGGGALPGQALPTRTVVLDAAALGASPERIAAQLRRQDPPIVARVARGALRLDPRTLLPGDADDLVRGLLDAAGLAG